VVVRSADWKPSLNDPEVQQYLYEEAGEEALDLAHFLEDHEGISGVDLLEHFIDRKPSDIRKILYRLMEAHVAEYEKDTDAKGWETFTWKLDLPEVSRILHRRWTDENKYLHKQLKFEQDHEFYACKSMDRRMVFEDAMDIGFHCPVCNEPMAPIDNASVVKALQERIDEIDAAITA
jgi:transcription initiation factor TFIIE subunit alpha